MSKKKRNRETPPDPIIPLSVPPILPIAETSNSPARRFSKPVLILATLLIVQVAISGFLVVRLRKESQNPTAAIAGSELDRILGLPDEEFNKVSIARINLLVSKEIAPDLVIAKAMADFTELVDQIKQSNIKHKADLRDPDKLIRVLNTYLYFEKKFRYAKLGEGTDPTVLSQDPKNLFLYGILDRMQGTCISMPVLYIALGEALGYPIKGVNAGDHFFCRWDGGGYTSNIEPTGGGGWSPDENYIRDMKVTEQQLKSGAYMKSLSKREIVGNFFFARAGYYSLRGENAKATQDLLKVVAWNSRDVDGYANLAELFARQAHQFGKQVDLQATYSKMVLNDIKRQDQEIISSMETGFPQYPMPSGYRGSTLPSAARGPAYAQPGIGLPSGSTVPTPYVPDPLKDYSGLRR